MDAEVPPVSTVSVDITTRGARTGEPRRIPINLHRVGDHWYLTSHPQKRNWFANLHRHTRLSVHFSTDICLDLNATARIIVDDRERRSVLSPIVAHINMSGQCHQLEEWVDRSPLVEVTFDA